MTKSPVLGEEPPAVSPAGETLWWGALNGLSVKKAQPGPQAPATEGFWWFHRSS